MFVRKNLDNPKIYTVCYGVGEKIYANQNKGLRAEITNINPNIYIGFFDMDLRLLSTDNQVSEEDLFLFYSSTRKFYLYHTPLIPNGRLL